MVTGTMYASAELVASHGFVWWAVVVLVGAPHVAGVLVGMRQARQTSRPTTREQWQRRSVKAHKANGVQGIGRDG